MPCTCGFSTAYPECNGTHKAINALKSKLIAEIEAIPMGESNNQLNALGMKMLVIDAIKKAKGV